MQIKRTLVTALAALALSMSTTFAQDTNCSIVCVYSCQGKFEPSLTLDLCIQQCGDCSKLVEQLHLKAQRDAAKIEEPIVHTNTTISTDTKQKDSDQAIDTGKTNIDSIMEEKDTTNVDETKNLNETMPATNTTDSGEQSQNQTQSNVTAPVDNTTQDSIDLGDDTGKTENVTDTDPKPIDDEPKGNSTKPDDDDEDIKDGGKNETIIPVDPAYEQSKQTCIATCGLKCKSESSDKKDACINLCFNQCTASIALYVQEKERPLLRSKSNMLVSLSQQQNTAEQDNHQLDESSESRLQMDEFMEMKLRQMVEDSPYCTKECVTHCGSLAELPHTEQSQLQGCFEQTCGCQNKMAGAAEEDSTQLMKEYFDMIHSQERVDYLMVLQNAVDKIVQKESLEQGGFLADASNVSLIKKKLGTEEGIQFYAQYLGQAREEQHQFEMTLWSMLIHLVSAVLITAAIVLLCLNICNRLLTEKGVKNTKINSDCEKAILKKQRLEQQVVTTVQQ